MFLLHVNYKRIYSENICYIKSGTENKQENVIDAEVDFVEYLGSEMNVHLKTKSNIFTARFTEDITLTPKTLVSILFDVNQGHFFNCDNENII